MALNAKIRRELIRRGHALKAEFSLSAAEISDAAVEHVQTFLADRELGKIRLRADSAAECEAAAAELARRVPCEVVSRVGRVLLLYRLDAAAGPGGSSAEPPPQAGPPSGTFGLS
jgi:RNA-binding protein YhbY